MKGRCNVHLQISVNPTRIKDFRCATQYTENKSEDSVDESSFYRKF